MEPREALLSRSLFLSLPLHQLGEFDRGKSSSSCCLKLSSASRTSYLGLATYFVKVVVTRIQLKKLEQESRESGRVELTDAALGADSTKAEEIVCLGIASQEAQSKSLSNEVLNFKPSSSGSCSL